MNLPSHLTSAARIQAAVVWAGGAFGLTARRVRSGWLWMLAGVAALSGWGADLPPDGLAEYELKAQYLYKFASSVRWPSTVFATSNAPLIIGVVGEDPFKEDLDRVFSKKKPIDGHPLVLKRFGAGQPPAGCHVLFIGELGPNSLADMLQSLRGASILTVGESGRFCEQGGMIQFIEEKRAEAKSFIRWEINYGAAEKANLKLDTPLLKLAKKVWGMPPKEGSLK